ncbi:putative Integral membrane protein [Seiridium cardinale]|uniref:Integral membrane protein n=1 Tax=Seiridium cardinale TaxID=138064 RepID=A0ABR2XXH3_9PEZI
MVSIPYPEAPLQRLAARELQEGTKQGSVFGVGIAFIILTAIVIGLRLYVRLVLVRGGLGWDDILMVLGTVLNWGLSIANMVCAWYGAGVHINKIPPSNYVYLLQSNYANRLLYVFAICLVKLSILVFYLRVDPRKWTRWTVYFIMANVIGLNIATAAICIFQCWLPSKYWDVMGTQAGWCLGSTERQIFFEANGILNIIQDIAIYLLPVPMLWNLQVSKRQKVALVSLFCAGAISLIAGGIRYYYVLKLANEEDIWYYFADSLNWCSIEVYFAIICGSASTFKILVKAYLPKFWGSSWRSTADAQRHQYHQSNNGDFPMKSFPSNKSRPNSDRGLHVVTITENGSKEAIVSPQRDHIVRSTEVKVEISDNQSGIKESKTVRKERMSKTTQSSRDLDHDW